MLLVLAKVIVCFVLAGTFFVSGFKNWGFANLSKLLTGMLLGAFCAYLTNSNNSLFGPALSVLVLLGLYQLGIWCRSYRLVKVR